MSRAHAWWQLNEQRVELTKDVPVAKDVDAQARKDDDFEEMQKIGKVIGVFNAIVYVSRRSASKRASRRRSRLREKSLGMK